MSGLLKPCLCPISCLQTELSGLAGKAFGLWAGGSHRDLEANWSQPGRSLLQQGPHTGVIPSSLVTRSGDSRSDHFSSEPGMTLVI